MPEHELVEYFIERTDQRFDELERKVDKLLTFKWQIIGGSIVLSGFVSLTMTLLMLIFKRG